MADFVEKGKIIVCLTENFRENQGLPEEKIIYTEKYQEVYRIAEILERLLADQVGGYSREAGKNGHTCIGIYSLSQERFQVPFAALTAKILGEKQKVLVIDLQQYSGLGDLEDGINSMGLEDLLSAVTTGNYSRSRMVECIRHEAEWDYVCATQNNQCLAEGTKDLYDALIDLMVRELEYQTIILNFGSSFLGQLELLEECQTVYLLCEKQEVEYWRETAFFQILLRQGKTEFMQRIQKVAIPAGSNQESAWRVLVEKWNWGVLGEMLRNGKERKMTYGAVM